MKLYIAKSQKLYFSLKLTIFLSIFFCNYSAANLLALRHILPILVNSVLGVIVIIGTQIVKTVIYFIDTQSDFRDTIYLSYLVTISFKLIFLIGCYAFKNPNALQSTLKHSCIHFVIVCYLIYSLFRIINTRCHNCNWYCLLLFSALVCETECDSYVTCSSCLLCNFFKC